MTPENETMECVGSLLVRAHDVQELSEVPSSLKKRVTAVGTLMIPHNVVLSSHRSSTPHQTGCDGHAAKAATDGSNSQFSSLQRRLTDKLMGPPPDDADADTWAD